MRFNTTDDSEKGRYREIFDKLFRTQNMEYYMQLLTALYEADQEAYALTQLTDSECRSILAETIARVNLVWWRMKQEKTEDEGFPGLSPSAVLDRFVKWGWLSKDFDGKIKLLYHWLSGVQQAVCGAV